MAPGTFGGRAGGDVEPVDGADQQTIRVTLRARRPGGLSEGGVTVSAVLDVDDFLFDLVTADPPDGARGNREDPNGFTLDRDCLQLAGAVPLIKRSGTTNATVFQPAISAWTR